MIEVLSLLLFFMWAVWADLTKGQIPTYVLLIPLGGIAFWFPKVFVEQVLIGFIILFSIWGVLEALKRKGKLSKDKTYLGFGDVLGVPLALGIVQAAFPILGLMFFAIGLGVEMPFMMKKKFTRFLPWLLMPVLLAIGMSIF